MNIEIYWHDYELWILKNVLKLSRSITNFYRPLFTCLHNTPFHWRVDDDRNRATDGMYQRNWFYEECGFSNHLFDAKSCSVLEMLTALAVRMDNEYTGIPGEPDPSGIFMEMLNNLGLLDVPSRNFGKFDGTAEILDKWMNREYEPNGKGGIFPLDHITVDQRIQPIWNQMNSYVTERENYT